MSQSPEVKDVVKDAVKDVEKVNDKRLVVGTIIGAVLVAMVTFVVTSKDINEEDLGVMDRMLTMILGTIQTIVAVFTSTVN